MYVELFSCLHYRVLSFNSGASLIDFARRSIDNVIGQHCTLHSVLLGNSDCTFAQKVREQTSEWKLKRRSSANLQNQLKSEEKCRRWTAEYLCNNMSEGSLNRSRTFAI